MSKHALKFVACLSAALIGGPVVSADRPLLLVTQSFAPFSYEESGQAAGPAVDIMRAVCDSAGVRCLFSVMPWRRAVAEVQSGQADGLFPLLPSRDREKTLWLSAPLLSTAYGFFVPVRSRWHYRAPADLAGMTLGVYGPSGTASALQEVVAQSRDVKTEVELNNLTAFRKLLGGRYGDQAAVFANREVGLALLKQGALGDLKPAGELPAIHYVFALSRQTRSAAQMSRLNQALDELQRSGQIKAILARHGLDTAPLGK